MDYVYDESGTAICRAMGDISDAMGCASGHHPVSEQSGCIDENSAAIRTVRPSQRLAFI